MPNSISCPHCGAPVRYAKLVAVPPSAGHTAQAREIAFLCPHCSAVLSQGVINQGVINQGVASKAFVNQASGATAPAAKIAAPADAGQRINWPLIRTQPALEAIAGLQHDRTPIYAAQGQSIGQILAHYGVADGETLRVAHGISKKLPHKHQAIGQTLVDIGVIDADELKYTLLIQAGKPMVDILALTIPPEVVHAVPAAAARNKRAMPAGIFRNTLYLAVADPFTFADRPFFAVVTGMKISLVYAPQADIERAIELYYPAEKPAAARMKGVAGSPPAASRH